MYSELKDILYGAFEARNSGLKTALATVVAVEGTSYRGPGVKMLVLENGLTVGAVSGGCVEKEIIRKASQVFLKGERVVMAYDGRYKLGCSGTLYILIEPIEINDEIIAAFEKASQTRSQIQMNSYFKRTEGYGKYGSVMLLNDELYKMSKLEIDESLEEFVTTVQPNFRLIIIGSEHDAVSLSNQASLLGWEIWVICSEKQPKDNMDFPSATRVLSRSADNFDYDVVDKRTAIVLMTHSYAVDLSYLRRLSTCKTEYIGVLGSVKRGEQLLDQLIETNPEVQDRFFDSLYTPVGLNIGAETPQEIALCVVAEILSVVRNKTSESLRNNKVFVHER